MAELLINCPNTFLKPVGKTQRESAIHVVGEMVEHIDGKLNEDAVKMWEARVFALHGNMSEGYGAVVIGVRKTLEAQMIKDGSYCLYRAKCAYTENKDFCPTATVEDYMNLFVSPSGVLLLMVPVDLKITEVAFCKNAADAREVLIEHGHKVALIKNWTMCFHRPDMDEYVGRDTPNPILMGL